ncbi:hypothetical protein [Cryobacterium arcticum]|uniref:Uncharacterized protein n=1 Tax=Cryobacterium arcticum TaxID=670052 RepID=A0A1B1BN78_9MICO|nr:hypothetical protein [Cryobacterium arcticum]ANP73956.1 hypothetical protein PA27867_3020 [Cryobacterium arcticum]
MPSHATPTITPGRTWVLLILGGIVTVFVVFAAIYVVNLPRPANTPGLDAGARPAPTESPAPEPVTSPTAVVAPGTPQPSSCAEIYSPAMKQAFGDLVLNPKWTTQPGADVGDGAYDPELVAVITSSEHLTCRWASPAGPSGSGVDTSVVWLSPEQTTTVTERLAELGYGCYEELGGLRCLTESETGGLLVGESHFLRGGVWLATRYTNAGPDGYTHDIINTLWAGT